MQFGVVEPLFGSLALWDASNGIKLTEDFHFQLNNEATLMGAIGSSSREIDPAYTSKNFGLSIDASHRSSRIYLVLIVSKVLVGDLDATLEVYTKGKDVKEKDRTKFVSENNELIRHLRGFRQQFAMAAIPIFKDDGTLASATTGTYDFKIDGFTRIKNLDVPDFLEEAFKADKKDKERKHNLPGLFSFYFRPFSVVAANGPVRNRISQSLAKAEPADSSQDTFREVANFVTPAFGNVGSHVEGFNAPTIAHLATGSQAASFSAYTPSSVPHHNSAAREVLAAATETVPPLIVASAASMYPSHLLPAAEPLNVVYFMPSKLNVEGLSGSGSRNICMEVKLLAHDSNPDVAGLAWLHGNASYLSTATLQTSARTSVWYHNKKPRFSDEFKFNVPISVSDKHHILVTIFHVNCKTKDKSTGGLGTAAQLEEPLAYAAIPLQPRSSKDSTGANTSAHKLIRNGLYTISLVSKGNMPAHRYLELEAFELWEQPLSGNGFVPSSAAKIPFGNPALEFQIRVNSNVHSADPIIDEYLQMAGGLQTRAMETDAKACLERFLARNAATSLIYQQSSEGAAPNSGLAKSASGSVSSATGYNNAAGPMSPHVMAVAAGASVWVDKTEILRFLPLLLTTHMSLIAHESRVVRQLAFVALLQTLVDAVEASPTVAPTLIQSYVDLIFDASVYPIGSTTNGSSATVTLSGAGVSETKLHVILLQLWAGLNTQLCGLRDVAMRFSWVLASLTSKSAALQLAEDKRISKTETAAPVKPNPLGMAPGGAGTPTGTPPPLSVPSSSTPRSAGVSPRGAPVPINENRSKWFPKLFYDALSDFLSSAAAATRHYHAHTSLNTIVAHRFTVHLASFIADLYAVVDRGQLNKLVVTYLDKMVNFVVDDSGLAAAQTPSSSNNLLVARCLFFKVLSQHPNFYAWNVPEMQDFKTGGEMLRKWQARHVLITSLLDTFKMAFHPLSSEQSRDLILDTLLDMMYRLDSREDLIEEESLYHPKKKTTVAPGFEDSVPYLTNAPTDAASATSKSKIAGMFLPYVYFLIDKLEYFESSAVSSRERNKALLPLLWVLKHAPYEILAKYWERDSEKRIFALLKLCSYAASAFELAPEKLIRVKREVSLPPNAIFSLTTDAFSSEDGSSAGQSQGRVGSSQFTGTISGSNSISGSFSSASGAAAMLAGSDFDLAGSPSADPDAMGLLSSGMRSLQVPGGGLGTSKKKGRGRLASDSGSTGGPGGSIGVSTGTSMVPSSSGNSIHASPIRVKKEKVDVDIEVRREINFSREVSLILVDTLVAFANTFPRALKRRDTFEQLWTPLVNVMGSKWTICATRSAFEAVYHLLPSFKVHFFAKQNSACPELIYNTLRACTAPQLAIRSAALAVLARIVQANFICTANIDRFRLQATIAIIKIVGSGSGSLAGAAVTAAANATPQAVKPGSGGHGAIPFSTAAPVSSTLDFSKLNASLAHVSKELLQDDAKALLTPSTSVLALNTSASPRPGQAGGVNSLNSTPRSATGTLSPSELNSKKGAVVKGLEELQLKVQRILDDVRKMKHYEYDAETLVDLYYGMSRNLEDSPDERIVWLENVAEMHRAQGNLEECAQAKILLAALVGSYLRILKRWELSQKIVPAFHLVAPNITGEDTSGGGSSPRAMNDQDRHHNGGINGTGANPANVSREYHESLRSVKDEVCQSAVFSAKGFSSLLEAATQLLKEGGFYESCAAAYRMILPTYYENDNYLMQKKCYAELQWLCQQILDENVMKQRIFSNYYRVTVYGGSKVGLGPEVNGVEFVYKEQPTVRLMDFTEKLKRKYEQQFNKEGSVVVLPNSQVVKVSELDANKIFMQICTVDIYWSPAELVERNTGFKQQFGAQRFVMEQPFAKPKAGGKESAQASSFEDQHIRRTIFTTYESFPHLLKRSRVVAKEEVELSPIECAIALIEKRSRALKAELSSSSPNMKNIQRELQGGVLTQVNAGPLAVIQSFLADDKASKYNTSPPSAIGGKAVQTHREILADCVSEFERSIAFGLALNKAMIGDQSDVSAAATQESTTQQTLQEELFKGLDRLRASMSACTIFASRKDAKSQLDEEQRRQEAERAHRTLGDENGISTIGTPRGTPRDSPSASASAKQPAKVSMIKKPESSPRGSPTSATAPIPAPLPSPLLPEPIVALPPPLISPREKKSKDKKDKDKEKEKDKDKEKRKLKKATTEIPTSTSARSLTASTSATNTSITAPKNIPSIQIPAPISGAPVSPNASAAASTAPSTPTGKSQQEPVTPKTPTSLNTSSGPSPRARAVSAATQLAATKTQADRDREREERDRERLAELKAKAKKTEGSRILTEATSSAPADTKPDPVAAAPIPAPVDSRKALTSRVDALVQDLLGRASVIQHGIPEASEPPELAAIIKSLKSFKEALSSVCNAFPSPPNPNLHPAPANTGGDKLAHYKAVCNNEVENIKLTLHAIAKNAPGVQPTMKLNGVVSELEKVGTSMV